MRITPRSGRRGTPPEPYRQNPESGDASAPSGKAVVDEVINKPQSGEERRKARSFPLVGKVAAIHSTTLRLPAHKAATLGFACRSPSAERLLSYPHKCGAPGREKETPATEQALHVARALLSLTPASQ